MSKHNALERNVSRPNVGKLADVLHELFQEAQVANEEETLFIAMYAFALELGFNSKNKREVLSTNWRYGHYYACTLQHQTCRDVQCRLLYAPVTPDFAMVYGFVNDEEVCNQQIQQKNFLSKEGNSASEEIGMYKDIELFARILKDNILFRILFFAQLSVGLWPTFGFMTIPDEIVIRILEYLPAKNLLCVSETNKNLYDLVQLSFLWERLFKRDFSDSEDVATDGKMWKDLYKEKYLQRKRRKEMLRNASIVLPRPFVPHLPDPFIPFPSGIIGNDRDRFPNLGLHPAVAEAFPNLVRRRTPLRFPHFPHSFM